MELSIDRICKTYPSGVMALSEVTLSVRTGLFGLLGPNGAGKSTLMRTLATLQGVDSGTIHLNGRDLLKDPQSIRQVLGYLPQQFGLWPDVSAWEMLDHIARLKGLKEGRARKRAVEDLLEKTHLHEVRHRHLGTFSGGMKQRFGIAQALLNTPELLVVDEPTAGLDPEERNRFHNLLGAVGEHMIVLFSTHIVEDISRLCTRAAIIRRGRILFCGETREAIQTLEGCIWSKTIPRKLLQAHEETYPLLRHTLSGNQAEVRALSTQPLPGFNPVQPLLEDFYFATIGAAAPSGEDGAA